MNILCGYFVSVILGAIFLRIVIDTWMWPYLTKKLEIESKPVVIFSLPLGLVERFLYTSVFVVGLYQWVPVWLGLKVAVSWNRWQSDKERGTYNIFLIGNAISIVFGYVGAIIILGYLPVLK